MDGEKDFLPFPSPLPTLLFLLMPSPLTAFPSLTHPPLFSELNMATAGNTEHLLVPKLLVRYHSRPQSPSFLGHVVLKRGAGLLGRCLWPKASISLLT